MDYEVGGGWYSTRPYQILKRTWRRSDNSHRKFALQITNPRRGECQKFDNTYFKERMTFEWLYRFCQNYSHQNWDRLLLNGLNLKEYSKQSGLIVAEGAIKVSRYMWNGTQVTSSRDDSHFRGQNEMRATRTEQTAHVAYSTFRKDTVMRWLT